MKIMYATDKQPHSLRAVFDVRKYEDQNPDPD